MAGKRKYKNAEYDDNMIEYLMKYLGLESYEQLQDFLKHSHIPLYNQIDFYTINNTKPFISCYPIFIMARDNSSNKYSKENYNLLDGMKRYLRIEYQDDDKELLDYLRKQAGLHRE